MNLTEYVRQVSLEDFGREFRHRAEWNSRLQTTGGRFFPKDRHLDFNPKIYQAFGLEVFRKIVRHELCHYHLYDQGKGYRHKDLDLSNFSSKWTVFVSHLLYQIELGESSGSISINVPIVAKSIEESEKSI